jgi:hypothetical protein
MSSASKSELAMLYYGCKLVIPICTTLEEMGHPQQKCTMVTTDNITTKGLTMGTMTPTNTSISSNAMKHNVSSSIFGVAASIIVQITTANKHYLVNENSLPFHQPTDLGG